MSKLADGLEVALERKGGIKDDSMVSGQELLSELRYPLIVRGEDWGRGDFKWKRRSKFSFGHVAFETARAIYVYMYTPHIL